jgi:hypothetical protein
MKQTHPTHVDVSAFTPHTISLAAWDLPLPLVRGRRSTIKVGARCAIGCALAGQEVEVLNEKGATVARGRVGDAPWPGTTALYWAEMDLMAPAIDGAFSWTVRLAAEERERPHRGASSTVSVLAVGPSEHVVTVGVIDRETQAPVEHVEVRLGVYSGATGGDGLVKLALPMGTYDLNTWKIGHEALSQVVDVAEDLTVQVELLVSPESHEEYWS